MTCMRCRGRMEYEQFLDLLASDYAFRGWRCINCGEIHDHVIVANRLNLGQSQVRLRKAHWS